jgi:hypothetical protein
MRERIQDFAARMNPTSCLTELQELLAGEGSPPISNTDSLTMVAKWHKTFFAGLADYLKEGEGVFSNKHALCGFNVVNDEIYYIASAQDLDNLLHHWNCGAGGTVGEAPTSLDDVMACIIEMIHHPEFEGKYRPADDQMVREIRRGAQAAGLGRASFAGGAAGNTAYVLGHLGVETTLHCPYHAAGMNWDELAPGVHYLGFGKTGVAVPSPVRACAADKPYKTTVGFQICPTWRHAPLRLDVRRPARALFIGKHPVLPNGARVWNRVNVASSGKAVRWPDPADKANQRADWTIPDAWPYPEVFAGVDQVRATTLHVDPVQSGTLGHLNEEASYSVAILGGLAMTQVPAELDEARRTQLDALRDAGVPIHTELSPHANLTFLKHLIDRPKGSRSGTPALWSVGLNQQDVLALTGDIGGTVRRYRNEKPLDLMLTPEHEGGGMLDRFLRARHILRTLDVDWVYVHGNELDMAVWRAGKSAGRLGKRLRDAMLFAKAAVVAGMIRRVVPSPLMPMIQSHLEGSALAGHGFYALAQFADEFVRWMAPILSQQEREELLRTIREDGFVDCGDGVGVSVAPVYWPTDVAPFLSATGAGDFTSAVVAAYVW